MGLIGYFGLLKMINITFHFAFYIQYYRTFTVDIVLDPPLVFVGLIGHFGLLKTLIYHFISFHFFLSLSRSSRRRGRAQSHQRFHRSGSHVLPMGEGYPWGGVKA